MDEDSRHDASHGAGLGQDRRRIIVVGPCASGKSTLVAALRDLGYDARISAQEHSEIATLWRRSAPDVLISLDVEIGAVRARRGHHWPEWLHDLQVTRLQSAAAAADLMIDTTRLDTPTMIELAVTYLQGHTPGLPAAR